MSVSPPFPPPPPPSGPRSCRDCTGGVACVLCVIGLGLGLDQSIAGELLKLAGERDTLLIKKVVYVNPYRGLRVKVETRKEYSQIPRSRACWRLIRDNLFELADYIAERRAEAAQRKKRAADDGSDADSVNTEVDMVVDASTGEPR